MRFICNSQDLQKGISIVEKAISSRSSLPILDNLFLELTEGHLKLRGNDLEIGIETNINIEKTGQTGSVLIKAKTLSSIISKLQGQSVEFKVDEKKKCIIRAENIDFDILGTDTNDYPVFPEIEKGNSFTLTVEELKQLIKQTIFSVSFDETKQFLSGILVKNTQDKLYFVATDGYRLALKCQAIVPLEKEFSVIIPHKALNELSKIIQNEPNEDEVNLIVSENQISFKKGRFLLISRVIQGQFPDYNQVIPSESQAEYIVSRKALLVAAERASIIAAASNNIVRLHFSDEKLIINANAAGMGDFKEELEIKSLKGQIETRIAFNIRLVLDIIKSLDIDDVKMSFNGELSPCKITAVEDSDFVYIIMPIRTSEYQQSPTD